MKNIDKMEKELPTDLFDLNKGREAFARERKKLVQAQNLGVYISKKTHIGLYNGPSRQITLDDIYHKQEYFN